MIHVSLQFWRSTKLTLRTCAATVALCAGHVQATVPQSVPYVWNDVSIGGGGFSPNIVFSPVERDLVYLRTDIGGLYRHDRKLERWIPLQDSMSEGNYFGVESVAPDPRNADVVYAAVGMYGSGPAAIIRSENRGASWTRFAVSFRMGGNEDGRGLGERLAIDPHDTDIVYFGSRHDGLQRSTDRGRSWTRVATFPLTGFPEANSPPAQAGISFVVFDPRSGVGTAPTNTLFVGVADGAEHHLFRSVDAGVNWQAVPREPRADLLPVRGQLDANGVLYLTYSNGVGPSGITDGAVFKLDTSTGSWQDITPSLARPNPAGGFMGLALDLRQPDTVLVATIDWWGDRDTIWRSTDAGQHWISLRPLSQIDSGDTPFLRWGEARANFGWWMAGLAIDPFDSRHVAYTTGATVYASDQAVPTENSEPIVWRPWVTGIEETAVLALISPPQGPPLLSGLGDIGGFVHEDLRISPPAMYSNPVFNNTDTLDYAGLAPNIVVRSGRPRRDEATAAWSRDFGMTWMPLQPPGLPDPTRTTAGSRRRKPETVLAVSADGTAIIATTQAAMLTRDGGQSWSAVHGLTDFTRPVADRVDPRRFYAVDFQRSRIVVSEDGGGSFAAVTSAGLPGDLHRPGQTAGSWRLLTTPGRAGDLWLGCPEALYHSVDGGRYFSKQQGNLSVTALAFGKSGSERDYPTLFAIGTRAGLTAIWRSDDVGVNWSRINDAGHEYGRRFRVIAGDPRRFGRVYVGTDGRGVLYADPAP